MSFPTQPLSRHVIHRGFHCHRFRGPHVERRKTASSRDAAQKYFRSKRFGAFAAGMGNPSGAPRSFPGTLEKCGERLGRLEKQPATPRGKRRGFILAGMGRPAAIPPRPGRQPFHPGQRLCRRGRLPTRPGIPLCAFVGLQRSPVRVTFAVCLKAPCRIRPGGFHWRAFHRPLLLCTPPACGKPPAFQKDPETSRMNYRYYKNLRRTSPRCRRGARCRRNWPGSGLSLPCPTIPAMAAAYERLLLKYQQGVPSEFARSRVQALRSGAAQKSSLPAVIGS